VAQGVPGKLRPRIFLTFGTTRVVGRQPYAPAAFTRREIPGTHFQRLSRRQGTCFRPRLSAINNSAILLKMFVINRNHCNTSDSLLHSAVSIVTEVTGDNKLRDISLYVLYARSIKLRGHNMLYALD
jgi:hypothetical protein